MSELAEKIRRLYVGAGDQSQRDALVDEVQAEVRALSTAREEARREAIGEAADMVEAFFTTVKDSTPEFRLNIAVLVAHVRALSQQKTGGQ